MLTFDFDQLGIGPGQRVLDAGCGTGRHTAEAARRGAHVVALDRDRASLTECQSRMRTLQLESQVTVAGDAIQLPFGDGQFDVVLASEVLEHLPDDVGALEELTRVLRPGGLLAASVPRWLPERICWKLSDEYHDAPGGHVRIYRRGVLASRLRASRLELTGQHYSHALHAPYWWLRCVFGLQRDDAVLPRLYHRLLVWQMMRQPRLLNRVEQMLNPLLGKSLVVYARKPVSKELGRPNAA